jgi:cell shape-determining protein MreC
LHGLKTDMAVLAPAGVVGRIFKPTARSAIVQLLIDRNAAAGRDYRTLACARRRDGCR